MKRLIFAFSVMTILYLLILSCKNSNDSMSSNSTPAKILILEDGGSQDTLFKFLDSAGFDVTLGGLYSDYTGVNFGGYDLVIFLNGVTRGNVMPDSVQYGLRNYVNGGGVLLLTEWFVYDGDQVILDSLSPVNSGGAYNDGYEGYLKQIDHPITAGLPDSIDITNPCGYWYATTARPTSLCTNIQTIYNGVVAASPQIVIGTYGSGRVVYWAMGGQTQCANLWISPIRQLFFNIANFSKTI